MKKLLILPALLFLHEAGFAQQCTCPNLGPELVVNGDFSAGNTGFSSLYTYSSFAWPGFYGITTNAFTNNSNWCTGGDHTTGSGNFFWVDASNTTTGVLIWSQSFTVQPNTNYIFSCWVNTLDPQGPGTLQFSINNQLIGPLLTAPSTLCTWAQYCVMWNSGSNTGAAVGIANQSVFFAGNDMGIDDISFKECQTNCNITVSISASDTICSGGNLPLNAAGGTSYSWSPVNSLNNANVPNPVANPTTTTTYTVVITDGNCVDSAFVTVTVAPNPVAIIETNTTSGEAPLTVQFTSASINAATQTWNVQPGDSTFTGPFNYVFNEPGTYIITLWVTNSNGCPDSTRITIEVKPNSSIYVPNAFTPNADGLNDVFMAATEGIEEFEAYIFDRWGNMLYTWTNENDGWNGMYRGDLVQEDVYVWKIRAIGVEGKRYGLVGHVSVIR